MKKLILIIIVLAFIGGGAYIVFNKPGDVTVDTTETPDTGSQTRPDPSNATFNIDGEPVTLSSGKAETQTSETSILEELAYGDINGDNKTDTVLFLSQYGGGSGVFIYLAGYVSGPVNYKGSGAYFLGDRIAPESISISGGTVTVHYLDRGPDDPFSAEPTVPTTKTFVFTNGEFVER